MAIKLNQEYIDLLLENSLFHKKVTAGAAKYNSDEWRDLQKKLTALEVNLSAKEIIFHAETAFPEVVK